MVYVFAAKILKYILVKMNNTCIACQINFYLEPRKI
jgi:hypothetical protein